MTEIETGFPLHFNPSLQAVHYMEASLPLRKT